MNFRLIVRKKIWKGFIIQTNNESCSSNFTVNNLIMKGKCSRKFSPKIHHHQILWFISWLLIFRWAILFYYECGISQGIGKFHIRLYHQNICYIFVSTTNNWLTISIYIILFKFIVLRQKFPNFIIYYLKIKYTQSDQKLSLNSL